jgi:hypothetical protein
MQVKVELVGAARDLFQCKDGIVRVSLSEGATVVDLLSAIGVKNPDAVLVLDSGRILDHHQHLGHDCMFKIVYSIGGG